MNALEFLKADHQRVNELFDEMDTVEEFEQKKGLFQTIKNELDVHSYLEETSFYPLFAEREGFEELIDDSLNDHQEVKSLLEEIDTVESEEDFDDRIQELQESVQSHVEEEENELFPKIELVMTEDELEELGIQLDEAKRSSKLAA